MTRHYDSNRIFTHRVSYRPGTGTTTNPTGQFPVTYRLTEGNVLKFFPHLFLKWGAWEGERARKGLALPIEVFL